MIIYDESFCRVVVTANFLTLVLCIPNDMYTYIIGLSLGDCSAMVPVVAAMRRTNMHLVALLVPAY